MSRPHLRVADLFRGHWQEYSANHAVASHPGRVVGHLLDCRTAELGGHMYRCNTCGGEVPLYNSCRDRHCPTCQTLRKQQWLEDRQAEILPVPYFHVVFTLPHSINPLLGANRSLLLGELFGAVNWVLQRFAADPQWKLQGQLGFIAVLHTWTQRLLLHYHMHCLVAGGAWNSEGKTWRSAHRSYLFGKSALSKAFQARFIKRLQALHSKEKLKYTGDAAPLADPAAWNTFIHALWEPEWVVYPKATAKRTEQALDYLARYTHRVAIGDHRILKIDKDEVTFSWRDRGDGNSLKTLTLPCAQFIGRFLLHILPKGFTKVRAYGWLASRNKTANLAAIRAALGVAAPPPPAEETTAERILRLTGINVKTCPCCRTGILVYLGSIAPSLARAPP